MMVPSSPHFTQVITRFAPSPTGSLHLGGLRTALYSYLTARKHGGLFRLRIEDTDEARLVQGAEEDILKSLSWAGLEWDGEVVHQSKRTSLYQKAAQRLMDQDHAYPCFCTPERLAQIKNASEGHQRSYDRLCRKLSKEEARDRMATGEPYVVRAKLPLEGEAKLQDGLRGTITVPYKQLEDMILLKSNGSPTYHLAHVVDDHDMKISHVLRGSEWIATLGVHDFLWQALSYPRPTYLHLPLILSPEGGKLSKRHGSMSVRDYQTRGYLPEGMINFLALLGWAYDDKRSLFTLSQLEELFDETKISKSAAQFSEELLNHYNQHYIKKLSEEDFCTAALPYLQKAFPDQPWDDFSFTQRQQKAAVLYQSRLSTFEELTPYLEFFFTQGPLTYSEELWDGTPENLPKLLTALSCAEEVIQNTETWSPESLQKAFKSAAKERSWKLGEILMPLRFAVTAQKSSPHIVEITHLLGRSTVLKRLAESLDFLKNKN